MHCDNLLAFAWTDAEIHIEHTQTAHNNALSENKRRVEAEPMIGRLEWRNSLLSLKSNTAFSLSLFSNYSDILSQSINMTFNLIVSNRILYSSLLLKLHAK